MKKDYKGILKEKCQKEYETLIEELRSLTSDEVIDRAYEKVTKYDLMVSIDTADITQMQAKALCRFDEPLDTMYQNWLYTDNYDMYSPLVDFVVDYAAETEEYYRESRKKNRSAER